MESATCSDNITLPRIGSGGVGEGGWGGGWQFIFHRLQIIGHAWKWLTAAFQFSKQFDPAR